MEFTSSNHDRKLQKCHPTGWRIEQKYSPGVLIGNWYESSHGKFRRGTHPSGDSTNRDSYQQYPSSSYFPDVSTRRKGLLRSDGLSKDQIFTHHGDSYSHNWISYYDQVYNRKYSTGLRQWNLHNIAWLPEASDHPLQGMSTNFGLKEKKEKKALRETNLYNQERDSKTVYGFSYRNSPEGIVTKRAATPRHFSSHLHPHNYTQKNLHFRGNPLRTAPEVVDSKLLKHSFTV